MKTQQNISIGIVTYNSMKYLKYCIDSLLTQKDVNTKILILDNASTDGTAEYISQNYPNINLIRSKKNIGFSRAHNKLISLSKSKYHMVSNVDIIFDKYFLKNATDEMESNQKIGSVSGKILKWDFDKNKKTNKIDSCGISVSQNHYFSEIGQGRIGSKIFQNKFFIFGVSGAASVFRRIALNNIKYKYEYYDESMFMYKEDIDLAYRMQWAEWKSVFCPGSLAWHDRTAINNNDNTVMNIISNRRKKSRLVRIHSFANHLILIKKNISSDFSFFTKFKIYFLLFSEFGYMIILEPLILFSALWIYFSNIKKTKMRQKKINKKISAKYMENLFKSTR